jgi:hypothetical protein
MFFIVLAFSLDEMWARQEKQKTFNWLCLLDEIVIGSMVGINLGYIAFLRSGDVSFNFPLNYLVLVTGAAVIFAILIEIMRPYRHYDIKLDEADNSVLQAGIAKHLKENSAFVYWDFQNPLYVTLLTIFVPLTMAFGAIVSFSSEPWISLLLLVIAVLVTTTYGGLRILVTRENITIRWGMLGIKVLKVKIKDLQSAEVHHFSPIKDFGGYGIRGNSEMSAYYLNGDTGVKLTTVRGKKYLIGSNNAARLAMVINAVASAQK